MKIILFVRSTVDFRSQRVDVDKIIERLIQEGNEVFIYDTHQRLFMDCNNLVKKQFLKIPIIFDRFIFRILINIVTLFYFCLLHRRSYDISQFLYIREEYLLMPSIILKVSTKNIATVYGSDINSSNIIKNRFTKFYKNIDVITATNLEIVKKSHIKKYTENKMQELMFPQVRLSSIKTKILMEKSKFRKNELFRGKIVITVGTNASANEQHLCIIKKLRELNNSKNDVLFVFPLTYGAKTDYIKHTDDFIKRSFDESKLLVFKGFQDEDTIVDLRLNTDIFINLRKNDQNSSSIFESLLAGNIMITGSWLPYSKLKNHGLVFFEIDSIDALTECISRIIDDYTVLKNQVGKNSEIIWNYFNPEIDLQKWLNLYSSLV